MNRIVTTMRKHIMISLAFMSALLLLQGGLFQPDDAAGASLATCSSGTSGCHFQPAVLDGTARNQPGGMFLGTHARHSGYSTGAKRQYQYACTKCHPSAAYGNAHQSGFKNITGSSLPGASYSATKRIANTNTPTFGNCSKIYCHSNGRGMGQVQYSSVRWGGTETCLGCHGGRNAAGNPARSVGNFTLTTTHSQHLKYPAANMNCQICHAKTATSALALKNYTGVQRHANGVRDVSFTDIAYGSYTSYKSNKTCTNTSCHGGRTRSAWSATAQNTDHTCSHCHGVAGTTVAAGNADGRLFAPGFRKKGTSTDQNYSSANIRVGSHFKHLSSAYMKNTKCNECHTVPSAPFGGGNHTLNTLRFNSNTLTFGQASSARILIGVSAGSTPAQLSTFSGYTNGTATKAATCSSVYCHGWRLKTGDTSGSYRKPYWNYSAMISYLNPNQACGRCHGNPPTTGTAAQTHSSYVSQPTTSCSGCHSMVVNASGQIINKSLHINGQVNSSGGHEYGFAGYKHMPGGSGTITVTSNTDFSKCTGCHSATSGGTYPVSARYVASNVVCTVCHKNNTNFFTTGSIGCGDCHGTDANGGQPNGAASAAAFPNWSGSHSSHISQTLVCADCHKNKGSGKFGHGNYSGIQKTRADVAIAFETTKSGTAATWVPASLTCTTSNCHGQKSPAWGSVVPGPQCARCHGYQSLATLNNYTQNSIAPGTGNIDTNRTTGTTARGGMHQEHLKATTGISPKVRCVACHVSTTAVNHATLDNNTTATVTFSGTATTQSHTTASVSRVNGLITCNNTYCHSGKYNTGSAMAPVWNDTAYLSASLDMASCKKCHNMPPATADHTGITNLSAFPATTCGCHTNLNSGAGPTYANIFTDDLKHINGVIEYVSSCTGCHATAVGGSPSPAGSRRQVVASAANTGEFSLVAGTKYTNMTSHIKTTAVSDYSCQFCHEQSSHKTYADGVSVKLQNTWAAGTTVYNGNPASLTYFCTGCHRSAGYGGTIPSGATGTATQPYKDSAGNTATPDNIFGDWSSAGQFTGTSGPQTAFTATGDTPVKYSHRKSADCTDCHGDNQANGSPRSNAHASKNGKFLRYSTAAGKYETQTCFNTKNADGVNACHGPGSSIAWAEAKVFSEFVVNNASAGSGGAHPILAAVTPKSSNISGDTTGTKFVNGWKSNSVATCGDCHGGTTGARGPHGSSMPYILKPAPATSPTQTTSGTNFTAVAQNPNAFCLNCHAAYIYGDGNGNKGAGAGAMVGHGTTSAWSGTSNCSSPGRGYMNNSCQNCHCGRGFSGTGTKGTHSTTATLGGVTAHTVGFANGNLWMGGPWGTGSTSGCYAIASATNYGNCNKGANHSSSDSRFKKNFAAIMNPLRQLFAVDVSRYDSAEGVPTLIESVKEQQRLLDAQKRDLDEIKGMLREMNR